MKFFSRVILPLVLFAYVGLDTYLKIQKSSICSSTGCKLAGELLKFDSLYLNYFGMAGAVVIAILGFFSLGKQKEENSFEKLFFVTLYSAIAFESIMIGYQVIANPEPCLFCAGVYTQLLLIALLARWRYFLYAVPVIVAMFISLSSLAITQNRSIITKDDNYLIHSSSCPHCKKVKNYFSNNHIRYNPISIKDVNARSFLKELGISEIPVLVIRRGNETRVLKGDHTIIEHFKEQSLSQSSKNLEPKSEGGAKSSIYKATDDGGCEVSIFSEASCNDDIHKQ